MPGDFFEALDRQTDVDDEFGEGIDRRRTVTFEGVLKPEFYAVEPTFLLYDERLPKYLTPYQSFDGAFTDPLCVARTCRLSRSGTSRAQVRIAYTFSTTAPRPAGGQLPLPSGGGSPNPGNNSPGGGIGAETPADLATEYSFDIDRYETAPHTDLDGKAILNHAGDVVNPAPTVPTARLVMTVRRWESRFDFDEWKKYRYARNNDAFFGYPPKRVLLLPFRCPARKEVGGQYWYQIEYTFMFADEDWELAFPSFGVNEKEAGTGKLIPIFDHKTGQPISTPVPLDADGKRIATPAAVPPAIKRHHVYQNRAFGPLLIEQP